MIGFPCAYLSRNHVDVLTGIQFELFVIGIC